MSPTKLHPTQGYIKHTPSSTPLTPENFGPNAPQVTLRQPRSIAVEILETTIINPTDKKAVRNNFQALLKKYEALPKEVSKTERLLWELDDPAGNYTTLTPNEALTKRTELQNILQKEEINPEIKTLVPNPLQKAGQILLDFLNNPTRKPTPEKTQIFPLLALIATDMDIKNGNIISDIKNRAMNDSDANPDIERVITTLCDSNHFTQNMLTQYATTEEHPEKKAQKKTIVDLMDELYTAIERNKNQSAQRQLGACL